MTSAMPAIHFLPYVVPVKDPAQGGAGSISPVKPNKIKKLKLPGDDSSSEEEDDDDADGES